MKKTVYHGSLNGNIEKLEARKSTHQKECIYATENRVVALLFMGKGKGDLDTRISNNDGFLELIERRPGVLKSIYDKEGYLYELDGTTFAHYDYLWSQEVISFEKTVEPLRKTHIPNILKAISEEEQGGNLKVYRYPDRPSDVPLDNSDLIDKYIRFERSGLTGAIDDLLDVYPEFKEEVEKRLNNRKLTSKTFEVNSDC